MTSRAQKDFDPSFASSSCPEVEIYGDNGDFYNKAIGINMMYHTFGYNFANSLLLII